MKILLLDTNFSSGPIYDYLIESGNEVYVIGNNPNDFLAKFAKNYIQSDYTKINRIATIAELDLDEAMLMAFRAAVKAYDNVGE